MENSHGISARALECVSMRRRFWCEPRDQGIPTQVLAETASRGCPSAMRPLGGSHWRCPNQFPRPGAPVEIAKAGRSSRSGEPCRDWMLGVSGNSRKRCNMGPAEVIRVKVIASKLVGRGGAASLNRTKNGMRFSSTSLPRLPGLQSDPMKSRSRAHCQKDRGF